MGVKALAVYVPPKKTLASADSQKWIDSIDDEMKGLIEEGVLAVKPASEVGPEDDFLPALLLLRIKKDGRFKARLVACGNFQKATSEHTHATAAAADEWLSFLTLSVRKGWSAALLDIKQAFLQTGPEFSQVGTKRTFLRAPNGVGISKDKVLEILKSVYGLRTAQSQWQATLIAWLLQNGFRTSQYTDCVLFGKLKGQPVIVITYVDDLMILGPRPAVDQTVSVIQGNFKTNELCFLEECTESDPWVFLWMAMWIENTELHISQAAYVESVVDRFAGHAAKPQTSLNEEHFKSEYLTIANDQNPSLDKAGHTEFRSLLGAIAHAALHTRRDVATATVVLAEGQAAPKQRHWEVALEILGFLKSTADRHLVLPVPPLTGAVRISGHADANLSNERARQGLAAYVGDDVSVAATFCRTQRQATYSVSTAESEIKALSWAGRTLVGLANVLREVFSALGLAVEEQVHLYGDNAAANLLARRQGAFRKIRHVSLADLWVREATAEGRLKVFDIPSDKNFSDMLTKVMNRARLSFKLVLLHLRDQGKVECCVATLRHYQYPFTAMASFIGEAHQFADALAASLSISPFDITATPTYISWGDADARITYYPKQRGKIRIVASTEERLDSSMASLDDILLEFVPAPVSATAASEETSNAKRPRLEENLPSSSSSRPVEAPTVMQYRAWLIALYRMHCPDRVWKVDMLLENYQGAEATLMDAFFAKYLTVKTEEETVKAEEKD